MGFFDAVKSVFSKYATFAGRARRSEYWYYTLFNILAVAAVGMIAKASGISMLSSLYALAVLLPGVAVGVRRLHDVGKSGWWMLIGLLPLIGAIWLLVLYCKDSEVGDNRFGPNPKGVVYAQNAYTGFEK